MDNFSYYFKRNGSWDSCLAHFIIIFQYFQNQKFLDCTLLVEGKHLLQAHKFVLDSCSDYFSSLLKNKLLDDKNLVICLPKEIKLWEIQALLVYMYNGQVAIEQEGLQSLVKCAEMLQIKGLCGNDNTECPDELKNLEDDIEETERTESMEQQQGEAEKSPSTSEEHNEKVVIKREVDISDVESCQNDDVYQQHSLQQQTGLIRVKSNLFETDLKDNNDSQAISEDFHQGDDDTQIDKSSATKSKNDDEKGSSSPQHAEGTQQYENIVCSPALMQYDDGGDGDDDDDVYIEDEANVCTNDALFQLITQKLGGFSDDSNDVDTKSKLMIASVSSQYQSCAKTKSNYTSDKKVAISGLYLRNPRGNQERKYDVNALYSALQDVKNGHSIYRWVACGWPNLETI